jgi:hypothetical protein
MTTKNDEKIAAAVNESFKDRGKKPLAVNAAAVAGRVLEKEVTGLDGQPMTLKFRPITGRGSETTQRTFIRIVQKVNAAKVERELRLYREQICDAAMGFSALERNDLIIKRQAELRKEYPARVDTEALKKEMDADWLLEMQEHLSDMDVEVYRAGLAGEHPDLSVDTIRQIIPWDDAEWTAEVTEFLVPPTPGGAPAEDPPPPKPAA